MVNTPAAVSRRSCTVSTELAMPREARNSLYRLTPDMMASLTMVRFHSSPSRPSAMALEFWATGTCSSVAVIVRLGLGLGLAPYQPAMDSPGAQQLCVPLAIRSGSSIRPPAEAVVDRAELGVQVRQVLLVGGPGDQVH